MSCVHKQKWTHHTSGTTFIHLCAVGKQRGRKRPDDWVLSPSEFSARWENVSMCSVLSTAGACAQQGHADLWGVTHPRLYGYCILGPCVSNSLADVHCLLCDFSEPSVELAVPFHVRCVFFILKRCWFHPWVRRIPWPGKWHPTPVFLPGKFHGQRSPEGSSLLLLSRIRRIRLCETP